MEIYEVRLKKWSNKDFISGEIYLMFLDEIGPIEEWFNYVNEYTLYDEVSIRLVDKTNAEIMLSQIKEQQQVEQIYNMFGDDLTPFEEAVKVFPEETDNENVEIIEMNISLKLWNTVYEQWSKE